jgi:hypothetical protein
MAPEPPSRTGAERRLHPRAAAAWPLTLLLEGGAQAARLRDVSRAGVSFYLGRKLPLMTLLELTLELPAEPPGAGAVVRVRGKGAVVRCERISAALEHYEVAVFLHDMAESDRLAIDRFVRARGHASAPSP